jgi:hypothetical protein
MRKRFCELAVGARFEFRGRRYEKMNAEVGRDEERAGNVFWPETEVLEERLNAEGRRLKGEERNGTQNAECKVQDVRTATPTVQRPGLCRPVRRRTVRMRLGRSAERDIRPYGTV